MACRHMLKGKVLESQRRLRQNLYILKSGLFKNGCVLFILHKDRNGLIQRLAYGPIGSYINMVWMDVRYDVIIDTICSISIILNARKHSTVTFEEVSDNGHISQIV